MHIFMHIFNYIQSATNNLLIWLPYLAPGILITICLALISFPIAIILGFLLTQARRSQIYSLRLASTIFTTTARALPEILTLFLIYYGLGVVLDSLADSYSLIPHLNVNHFLAGVAALSIVSASYISEVFLASYQTINLGQYEAAYSLGLSRYHKSTKVILPQLLRQSIGGLSNIWLVLLKDTSMVSIIGLSELTYRAQLAQRTSNEPFLFYFFVMIIFLLFTVISLRLIKSVKNFTNRGYK